MAGRKTVILITHRLANVRGADRIFVMENGKVAESGSHRELMALGGEYYTLFSTQAARYIDSDGDGQADA